MALFQKSFKGKKIKLNGKTGVGKERDLFFHGKKNGRKMMLLMKHIGSKMKSTKKKK